MALASLTGGVGFVGCTALRQSWSNRLVVMTTACCRLRLTAAVWLAAWLCAAAADVNVGVDDHSLPCAVHDAAFELWTGYVFTSPGYLLDSRASVLQLSECVQLCRANSSCLSVNYETGLCVLFSSNADKLPDAVTPSQYPVFTLYVQKVCLGSVLASCRRPWTYERVAGRRLARYERRTLRTGSRLACLQMCLHEHDFICRSVSYSASRAECILSEVDRFTMSESERLVDDEQFDYYESNCADDPVSLCEFEPQPGVILKTVDAVHQNVESRLRCQQLCLSADFRCHTYDYGDTGPQVCRLSHHSDASLAHVRQPYLHVTAARSWRRQSCYNVTLQCDAQRMVATIRTSRVFSGKIYARNSASSCMLDVQGQMAVTFPLSYHDLSCDVRQQSEGVFVSDVIIQHHDQLVTSADVGMSLRCVYSLSNTSVALTHSDSLSVSGQLSSVSQQTTVISSPNITMSITDRHGADIQTAQVGDALALRFEMTDVGSPYEMLVRQLVAQDGRDSAAAEIVLIDGRGCPAEPAIMGAVSRVAGSARLLSVPFDAFKFPGSAVVQFKALVTPCLPSCRPADCHLQRPLTGRRRLQSYGRRRRRRDLTYDDGDGDDDDVLVITRIHIADSFPFDSSQQQQQQDTTPQSPSVQQERRDDGDQSSPHGETEWTRRQSGPLPLTAVVAGCAAVLVVQLTVVVLWRVAVLRRQRHAASTNVAAPVKSVYDAGHLPRPLVWLG